MGSIRELVEIACHVARPKAVYETSYVENRDGDSLDIGGVTFSSRVLRVNLDGVERVFPFIATCGREIDEVSFPSSESARSYYMDQIRGTILSLAMKYLREYVGRNYAVGQLSTMFPGSGSLDVWPIKQQEQLFSVCGGRDRIEGLIGVTLTERLMMVPVKSLSGIFFPTEIRFQACQLCPREECISRQAAYDPDLVRKYKEAAL
jgi:hypothetical protein